MVRWRQADDVLAVGRRDVHHAGRRIDARALPVGPARRAGIQDCAEETARRPIDQDRRLEQRTPAVVREQFERLRPHLGGEVDQVVLVDPLQLERRWLRGKRLRRGKPLARHRRRRDGTVLDGPDRFAGDAVEDVREPLLAGDGDGSDLPPVDRDVHQIGGRCEVVVPDTMADGLEIPLELARRDIDTDEALRIEIVARAVAAVVVVTGRGERQVRETPFRIGGRMGPHVGVAAVDPRRLIAVGINPPGLDPGLAFERDGVERPELLAGPDIEAADVTPRRLLRGRHLVVEDVADKRADDDDLVHDERRRVPVVIGRIADQALPQVDHPVVAEVGIAHPGPRIDRDQFRPARRKHARLGSVRPVGNTARLPPSAATPPPPRRRARRRAR